MASINDAFSFAKTTLQTSIANNLSPFVLAKHKLELCLSYMSDEASRINYLSELSYLMVRLFNPNLAKQISPFTEQDWVNTVAKWDDFVASAQCPKMVCEPEEKGYLANMLITTFLAGQYQYEDKVKVTKGDIFIDGGACFGDTALWAYQNGASKVYSFEPSPYNFTMLQKNIEANGHDTKLCFNQAVSNTHDPIKFAAAPGMAGASHADSNGNIEVGCVILDEWVKEQKIKPTFLKLDIEGAEVSALKGAKEIITKYHPKLTICLYHQLSDMWEVPLLIKNYYAGYRFYCRKNNVNNEFILYAAP